MVLRLDQWPLVHTRLRRGRPYAHEAPAAVPAADLAKTPPRSDLYAWQAAALCDLIQGPKSGITRIHIVGAHPALVDILEAEATRRGLPTQTARSAALGTGRATIERTGAAQEGER